jgi:hypothetical protein
MYTFIVRATTRRTRARVRLQTMLLWAGNQWLTTIRAPAARLARLDSLERMMMQ